MMIIEKIFGVNDQRYPYKYRISVSRDCLVLMETVQDWVKETNFKCIIVPGAVYVPEEKDAIWFVLKWSS